jgi:hypothetical protein
MSKSGVAEKKQQKKVTAEEETETKEVDVEEVEAEPVDPKELEETLPAETKPAGPPGVLIAKRKEELLAKYHGGSGSLKERLHKVGSKSIEDLVMNLVDEVIQETDSLLGNELISEENGDLKSASVISFKRAEVLEKAIKAIQTKQMFDKGNKIDANSPSMRVIFKYFMGKVKYVFEKLKYPEEASDTFFRFLADGMDGWQKELQDEIDAEVT